MARLPDTLRRVICRAGLAVDNAVYTGPEGELVYVTDDDEIFIHDGITAGGILVGGGDTTYLALTDTPSVFTGEAGKLARVNAAEDAIEFVPNGIGLPFKGALVKLDGDLASDFDPAIAIIWESEEYDIGDFWTSGAATRLTVPANVTRVELHSNLWNSNETGNTRATLQIYKNGSADWIGTGSQASSQNTTERFLSCSTAVIDVIEGDYFEAFYQASDGATTVEAERSTFSIKAVEGVAPSTTPRGALVHLAANDVGADYTSIAAIPFDAEAYDTDDIHDNSTNNTRLTVPAGVTHVRLTGCIALGSTTSNEFHTCQIRKGGSADFVGAASSAVSIGSTFNHNNTTTSILEVVAGDYFELFFQHQNGTVTIDDDRTNFGMEIVNGAILGDGGPLDVDVFKVGEPTNDELLLKYVFTRDAFFPSGLTGSQGHSGVAALAETDYDLQKNGVSIGTARWAVSGTVATFIFATSQQFAAGDKLHIIAPGTADDDHADISITLKGARG